VNAGLLWFDDDPRASLEEKVGRAAQRYLQKFGRPATHCLVNPRDLAGRTNGSETALRIRLAEGLILVAPTRHVLPHHFWVGISEEERPDPEGRSS